MSEACRQIAQIYYPCQLWWLAPFPAQLWWLAPFPASFSCLVAGTFSCPIVYGLFRRDDASVSVVNGAGASSGRPDPFRHLPFQSLRLLLQFLHAPADQLIDSGNRTPEEPLAQADPLRQLASDLAVGRSRTAAATDHAGFQSALFAASSPGSACPAWPSDGPRTVPAPRRSEPTSSIPPSPCAGPACPSVPAMHPRPTLLHS